MQIFSIWVQIYPISPHIVTTVGTVYTGHKKRMSSRFSVTAHCNALGISEQDRRPRRKQPGKRKRAPVRRRAGPKRKRKPRKPRRAKSAKRVAQGKRIAATLERDTRGRFLPAGGVRRAVRPSRTPVSRKRVRIAPKSAPKSSRISAVDDTIADIALDALEASGIQFATIKEGLNLVKSLASIFKVGKELF